MASIGRSLKIKYGLGVDPSDSLASRWTEEVQRLVREGMDPERAGALVAQRLFVDFQTHHYASEADTIKALLEAAGKK